MKKKPTTPRLKIATPEEADAGRITPDQARAWKPDKRQRAQMRAQAADTRRMARAALSPLPGPLRDAFAAKAREIFGVQLQPITATHVAALVRMKSPFIEGIRLGMLMTAAESKADKKRLKKEAAALQCTEADTLDVLYIFSLTPDQVRTVIEDTQTIRVASSKLMDAMPPIPGIEMIIGKKLGEHYLASFSTHVQHRLPSRPGDPLNFPQPGPSKTGSAGS